MSARVAEESLGLLQRLEGLRTALLAVPDRPETLAGLAGRALQLAGELAFLLRAEADDHVYFVETRGRGVFLRAMPIDVSDRLKVLLFDAPARRRAHLGHARGRRRLRLREGPARPAADARSCCSPRRSTTRSRPCSTCPSGMPEPQSPEFVDRAAEEIVRLLELSRGRAFVLFTSYANMNAVAERIAGRVDYPLLVQGEAPEAALLDTFRGDAPRRAARHHVLLAGRRRGGRAALLRDRRQAAVRLAGRPGGLRAHRAAAQPGANPFGEYQVPVAVLMLKQGLGRLIRTTTDRGILAVLDSRLLRKSYGRRFLESLPPARLVHDLDEVARFMA